MAGVEWLSLVATIWLQSINGTNATFPSYSSQLKKILSLSQLQLNNLASASDAGKLLGWLSGVAAAHLPLPLVLLLGSSLGLLGYGVQFLFLAGHIQTLSYWHLFALTALAGNSICWINTVSYLLAIRNFPLHRHLAVGLSTSYVGLSAKLYTDLVTTTTNLFSSRAQTFLLFNSAVPFLISILASPFAVAAGKPRASAAAGGGFSVLFVITVFTGLFAVITSLVAGLLPPLFVVVGMLVFLLMPLVLPLVEKFRETKESPRSVKVYDDDAECGGGDPRTDDVEESGGGGEEIGAMLMLRSVEFWLYFFAYLLSATVGLVYLNNLGQISESRGCLRTSSLVSLASSFGFFGRLLPSLVNFSFSKLKVSTTMGMVATMAPLCGAFLVLGISGDDVALYVATAIVGICTGAISSISVAATTELFGAKNFGVNHNVVVLNIPIGSFVLGYYAAVVYNSNRGDGEDNCVGHKCYQTTFLLWSAFCVTATFLALTLHFLRTKKLRTQQRS